MNFVTLRNKEKVFDDNLNQEKINMAKPSIKVEAEFKVIDIHIVREDDQMRPDLIAIKYYGDDEGTDLILKANGISNPFSIKEGQEIIIPDKDSVIRYIQKTRKSKLGPREQFTNSKRMSQQDQKRKEFLKQKSATNPNGSSENLPPNVLKSTDTVKTFKNNKIFLGTNLRTNLDE